jgi:hypothetical protein
LARKLRYLFMELSREAMSCTTLCVLFSHTEYSTLIEMSVAVILCMQEILPCIAVEWAAILPCIQEVQGLNLDPKSAMFPDICSQFSHLILQMLE